jgi:hypothetical protein
MKGLIYTSLLLGALFSLAFLCRGCNKSNLNTAVFALTPLYAEAYLSTGDWESNSLSHLS